MAKTILGKIRNLAFSYVYIQAIVILCIALFLVMIGKHHAALSFFWGGFICILPNVYFAYKLFRKTGARAAKQIITSFYISELVKFIITFVLFAIAFKYFSLNKLALFIGYIVAQLTFWFAALFRHQAVNRL